METKKYQLPKEFATKWISALRSGEFPQGKLKLRTNDGYCCLGVACAMYGFTDLFNQQYLGDSKEVEYGISNSLILPVLELIPKQLVGGADNHLVNILVGMNDKGNPFTEIADWIEQNVEFI